jgi:hypothetical protein
VPKGATFDNDLLKLLFNATAISLVADNTGTTPLTFLYVALHTASPGAAGAQTASEAAYTSYARVAVARTTGGWSAASGGSTSPVAAITFPAATGGNETETYASIGSLTTGGAGKIFYYGAITPNIAVVNGVTPSLTTASTITEA